MAGLYERRARTVRRGAGSAEPASCGMHQPTGGAPSRGHSRSLRTLTAFADESAHKRRESTLSNTSSSGDRPLEASVRADRGNRRADYRCFRRATATQGLEAFAR